jgi:hypothetical protein
MATRAVAIWLQYVALDGDNKPLAGDLANHTVDWSPDDSGPTTCTNNQGGAGKHEEIGNGRYRILLTVTETDCASGMLGGVSATSGAVIVPTRQTFDPAASPQGGSESLAVSLVDDNGDPIPNLWVTLLSGTSLVDRQQSDTDGEATVTGNSGIYELVVVQQGMYLPSRQSVTLPYVGTQPLEVVMTAVSTPTTPTGFVPGVEWTLPASGVIAATLPILSIGDASDCVVSFDEILSDGEVLIAPVSVVDAGSDSDLSITNVAVNSTAMSVEGNTVAIGKALCFCFSGQSIEGTPYTLRLTVTTNATPGQTIERAVRFSVKAA